VVTSIVAFMRMVISSGVRVGAPAASLASGGTGLARIGQVADIAVGQGPAVGAETGALPDNRGTRGLGYPIADAARTW
jgi:hypothetical protein